MKTETLRVRNVVDATRLGAWLRSGEGIGCGSRLALCQILSIECPSSIFFWHVYFVILVLFSLLFLFVFFFCSRWSFFVDVPLVVFCPADQVPDWQPRVILLGRVEARSVNVKKTTTTTTYVQRGVPNNQPT